MKVDTQGSAAVAGPDRAVGPVDGAFVCGIGVGDSGGGGGDGIDGDGGDIPQLLASQDYGPARRLRERVAALDTAAAAALAADGSVCAVSSASAPRRKDRRDALRSIARRLADQASVFPSGQVTVPRRQPLAADVAADVAAPRPSVVVVHVSDTHRRHDLVALPTGDLLLHTGDILDADSSVDLLLQWESFLAWLERAAERFKHGRCMQLQGLAPSTAAFLLALTLAPTLATHTFSRRFSSGWNVLPSNPGAARGYLLPHARFSLSLLSIAHATPHHLTTTTIPRLSPTSPATSQNTCSGFHRRKPRHCS